MTHPDAIVLQPGKWYDIEILSMNFFYYKVRAKDKFGPLMTSKDLLGLI